MRVGQKNPITRRWAKRGTRPAAPKDQRTASAYLFGAICPKEGKAAAIVMPRCVTEAMSLHLAEISRAVAPDAHAVILLDQAGWHQARALVVPDNITLMPLPPYAPELNPCELLFAHQKRPLANHALPDLECLFDHADDHLQGLRHRQDPLRSFIRGTPLNLRWPT